MALAQEKTYTINDIYALPDGQRAELIDGQIYNMAPPNFLHQKLVMELSAAIHQYIKSKKGNCEVLPAPFAIFLNQDNQNYVEPDMSVIKINWINRAVTAHRTGSLKSSLLVRNGWTVG